ncbi:N-6 DNA methylase [Nocardiopsis sp. FR26]|uniref:N-6 DNA methylase n=1 Tax=Nocardiopsis sp. FR26 TaxID=2605987 RepID=UPI001359A4A2|nr:N-6 DNA methylase [Nocardiopsis sp. FR26]
MGTGDVRVSSADIARIAGVKPTAVSNWRRRHEDFPQPVGGTDRSPRFDLAQVEEWLAAHRQVPGVDPDQRLWQALDSLRSLVPAEAALVWAGVLLLYLDAEPAAAETGTDPAALLERARLSFAERLERAGLDALAARPPEGVPAGRAGVLVDAAVRAAGDGGARSSFGRLLGRLDQRSPSGSHTVPPELADLMVRLAGDGAVVADPACGRGELLLAAARAGRRALRGQDREGASVWSAALRLAFADALTPEADLRVADALRSPAFGGEGADTVLCAPPFGERNWGAEELAEDPRWRYGAPPRLESDLAWVQHCLSLLRPGGSAVVLMPPGAAQRPSGRRIRRSLLRAGAFGAVVSLPPGFAAHYAVPLQLWVLRAPEEGAAPGPVLLVDTDAREPGRTPSAEEVAAAVDGAWKEYRADPEGFTERPGAARAVDAVDLMDGEADLTPRTRLPVPRAWTGDPALFAERRGRMEGALRSLRALLPEAPEDGGGDGAAGAVTLAELAKAGSVTIRRPVPRRSAEEGGPRTSARVLTGEDVVRGAAPERTEEVDADPMRNPPIQEGDVLIPALARRPTARVAGAADAGAYPGVGLYVVRTNPAAVDPWFLAGLVASSGESANITRVGSSMRGHLRVDPSRMRLPVLPVEEQRRHGELFRRVARFREALAQVRECGEELADQAVDLIAARWQDPGGTRG